MIYMNTGVLHIPDHLEKTCAESSPRIQRKVSGGLDETYATHGSKVAMSSRVVDFLLYCGISRDDFNSIRNQLWKRNTRAVHIAVMLAGGIGALLLLINLIMQSSVLFPYLFLVCGSVAVSGLIELIRRKNAVNEIWQIIVCYAGIITVCIYAGILTTQASHFSTPA